MPPNRNFGDPTVLPWVDSRETKRCWRLNTGQRITSVHRHRDRSPSILGIARLRWELYCKLGGDTGSMIFGKRRLVLFPAPISRPRRSIRPIKWCALPPRNRLPGKTKRPTRGSAGPRGAPIARASAPPDLTVSFRPSALRPPSFPSERAAGIALRAA